MKFASLTSIAPGASLAEQCAAIAQAGCAGVETIVFPTTPLEYWQREMRAATTNSNLELVAVILGGLALHHAGQMPYVREAMQAIAELGAAALLTPEYAAQQPLPLFPPYPAPPTHEQTRADEALHTISGLATQLNARVLIEPITQFESRFCRDVHTAIRMCDKTHNPLMQIVLDTHNINITEANVGESIRATGHRIGHVHLSDNNRQLPGCGHIDFVALLAALAEVSYHGWYSFECAVGDDFVVRVRDVMQRLQDLEFKL